MKIEIRDNKAYIYTPYSPEFVARIKNIGGRKWESSLKCWSVPSVAVDSIRKIMMEVFKETDEIPAEKVDVQVTFHKEKWGAREAYMLFGKSISIATGRDSGARVGDDVEIVKGSVSSGGSAKNWASIVDEGSVVILRNVSKPLLESFEGEDGISVEVIDSSRIDRQALLEEKERLLNRLAEIKKLLGE